MDFYERVKALVKNHNLQLIAFLESLGIDYNSWKGSKRLGLLPRADDAVKIAMALDTSVEYLVTGSHPYNHEAETLRKKIRSFLQDFV